MGQGVHTVARQVVCQETGLDPKFMEVRVDTASGARSGMTTARAPPRWWATRHRRRRPARRPGPTALAELVGRELTAARWRCDWTTAGPPGQATITHYSYGYATPARDPRRRRAGPRVIAAHDAGQVVNPTLFEGQIEGAVVMGLGYALSEDLPLRGRPAQSTRLRLRLLRAKTCRPSR